MHTNVYMEPRRAQCKAHLRMVPPGYEDLNGLYLWAKFQAYRIIPTPSMVGPKFNFFIILYNFLGFFSFVHLIQ